MVTKNQDASNSGMVTSGHEQPGFAFQIELHNRGTKVGGGAMVNLKGLQGNRSNSWKRWHEIGGGGKKKSRKA